VFEVKKDKTKTVAKKIKEIMETVYKLKVPIEAEVKVGKNWGEQKELKV
jgi:DNA polymerase-1